MPEKKSRFVLLCRHLLAVGTVLAVAAPAATVVDLDIVLPAPDQGAGSTSAPQSAGSLVASEPVEPTVTEEPVDGVEKQGLQALTENPRAQRKAREDLAALSAPEPVEGYATVGVTWKHGAVIDEDEISVSVRTLEDGEWSGWEDVEYHDDHGPDPDSTEARNARPGTEPLVVGDVDSVQVKAVTDSGETPADMSVALVDPGEADAPSVEEPAIDTAELASAETDPITEDEDSLKLSGSVTARPKIYSRKQWGANEKMRDGSPKYFEVHAGFVHHTVNSNSYTRAQVPSIMRGIYAYHTQSRGWSDIGYNYIVDKFGRIWEGRYGGVDRPVVGAHTLGYNEYSFAMSALGNFDIARPSTAMLRTYGRLMAWKLSLHGVDAADTSQRVGSRTFRAISGHRDAGSTACPGRYLYAKLGTIRSLANSYQASFAGREKSTNLSGSAWPDLVVRDKKTQRAYVVRTGGQLNFQARRTAARGWGGMDLITPVGDVTGDGKPDMMGRKRSSGVAAVYPGNGSGQFGPAKAPNKRFAGVDQLAGVMDLNGDGRNDIVARDRATKRLYYYRGTNRGWFRTRRLVSPNWQGYNLTTGVGDMSGDGRPDVAARDGSGRLWLWRGNGRGRFTGRTELRGNWNWRGFDLISGLGDVTSDGKPDLVARSAKNKLVYVYPGTGKGSLRHYYGPFDRFKDVNFLASVGHVAGNRRVDLVARGRNGSLVVFPNDGRWNLGAALNTGRVFSNTNLILNVGDWDGDGQGDVVTRSSANGLLYLRRGAGGTRLATASSGSLW